MSHPAENLLPLELALKMTSGRISRTARLVLSVLDRLEGVRLLANLPDGQRMLLGRGDPDLPLLGWQVHRWSVFDRIVQRGDIGFAEAWIDGDWDTADLRHLLQVLARNRGVIERLLYGQWWQLLLARWRHRRNDNDRDQARRNIVAHYDLGNAFYRRWLDDSMSYSAAIFATPEQSLEAAQLAKYERVLAQLGARPGDHILEIGCGWGGFAEVAVTRHGCRVHGVSLSPSQLAYAEARATQGGWNTQARFELCDYRDLQGSYDHIVSIEMIEAVGERHWDTYFERIAACLRPGGRCLIQSITIADALFARYRRGTDFIQQYVFPGGMLPSPDRLRVHARKAGLDIDDGFRFGTDYARTLAHWQQRYLATRTVEDASFDRLWRLYLAYCEAGFIAGMLDVHQLTLTHSAER